MKDLKYGDWVSDGTEVYQFFSYLKDNEENVLVVDKHYALSNFKKENVRISVTGILPLRNLSKIELLD